MLDIIYEDFIKITIKNHERSHDKKHPTHRKNAL